jgi:hypothetical protein
MTINETATGNDSVAITGSASAGERTVGVKGRGDSVGIRGEGKAWNAVEGISQSTIGGAGVFGANDTGAGVRGQTKARFNPGVHGMHIETEGPGIQGEADNGAGTIGISKTWIGVFGETNAPASAGASAVLGEGKNGGDGVKGHASGPGKAGVAGFHLTNNGPGIFGRGSPAGVFEGDVRVTGNLQGPSVDALRQRITQLEQQGASAVQLAQRLTSLEQKVALLEGKVSALENQVNTAVSNLTARVSQTEFQIAGLIGISHTHG